MKCQIYKSLGCYIIKIFETKRTIFYVAFRDKDYLTNIKRSYNVEKIPVTDWNVSIEKCIMYELDVFENVPDFIVAKYMLAEA